METITTTNVNAPNFKIAVAIDVRTAVIVGLAMFVAVVAALVVYKYLPNS